MALDNKNEIKNITLTTTKSESWEIPIAIFVVISGIIASYWVHYLAAALNLLGFWIFIKHNLGSSTFITRFFPKQNVNIKFFQSKNTTESKKNLLLMIPERFFSNNISAGFSSLFKYVQFAYVIITGLSILWLYSKEIMMNQMMYFAGNGILLLLQISFFALYVFFHKSLKSKVEDNNFTQIVETLQNVENLHILQKPVQGALSAMQNFIENNEYSLNSKNTLVINVSDFLYRSFSVIKGEGVIVFHQFENQLVSKAKGASFPTKENKIYPSALLPFINNGFQGISLEFGQNQESNLLNLQKIINY